MMNFSSFIENTFVMLWILITLLIFNGCEPEPKMIGYGSNEYSQLEFPGTNWNHEQLSQGYTGVWVGGNFTIAANYGGLGFPSSGMLCKGDSSLGQCDFPSELPDHFNSPEIHENISLGLNHGMAVVIDSNSVPLTSINQDTNFSTLPSTRLILWGDNSLNQTTIPDLPDTNHIFQIAAGNNHNIIHIADAELTEIDSNFYFTIQNQRLISWGDNTYGQCNIPFRFNPLSDSLTIVRIDAGANHTIVTYDSSGVIKMAAWGDNTYGQSNELSSLDLNGDKTLLDIFCGYNHNVVITYNPNINYYSDIEAGNIVDTLVISSQTTQSNDPWALFPISIHAWGDNSYGQLDIPTLSGHFEAFEAGGFHNTIATTENIFILEPGSYYDYGPPVPGGDLFFSSTGREITGWGKNDFGQSEFPVEYIINWVPSDSTIEGYPAANSPPNISSGENHTIITGSHIYRAPSMDYNNLNVFNGALGDTIYQTLIIKNIGPDTLHLDTLFIHSELDSIITHPFYFEYPSEQSILYGDSISLQVFTIYDSLHSLNESATLYIYTNGFFDDEITSINIGSFFGPQINITQPDNFVGHYDETVVNPITISNVGFSTAYIDYISIPNLFELEPYGEQDSISPGDSLVIYLYTTLPEEPISYGGLISISVSNFNSIYFNFYINANRYFKLGDNVSNSYLNNVSHFFCGPMENTNNYFTLSDLDNLVTKVHYFDFGYFKSGYDSSYYSALDIVHINYQNNPYFLSMLGLDSDLMGNSCDQLLLDNFSNHNNVGLFIKDNLNNAFDDNVESVVFNKNAEITYLDTFNLQEVSVAINQAIEDCGLNCLSGEAIVFSEDITDIHIEEGSSAIDSVFIQNNTDYNLEYSLDSYSGGQIIHSVIFNNNNHDLISNFENSIATKTISFWFKPIPSNWSNNEEGYTNFISSNQNEIDESWKIILDNSDLYPRLGFKLNENTLLLSDSPILGNDWYNGVIVKDSINNELHLYINGILEGSVGFENDIKLRDQLGVNLSGPGLYTGFLSKTAFWANSLSNNEILYLYELGLNENLSTDHGEYISSSDLILNWRFDENNGSNVYDYSGNDNNAILGGDYSSRWRTELIDLNISWLSIIAGASGNIDANSENMVLIGTDATDLEMGDYYGTIFLNLENNALINNQIIVRLSVSENLDIYHTITPISYNLHQNYPNPFNPTTQIKYDLPQDNMVTIKIYDILGRNVRTLVNTKQTAGYHSLQWDAKNNIGSKAAAGMYIYTIQAGEFNASEKMVLLK